MQDQLSEYREAQRRRFAIEKGDNPTVDSQGIISNGTNDPSPMDIDSSSPASPAPSAPPQSPKLSRRIIPPSPQQQQQPQPQLTRQHSGTYKKRQLEEDEELARILQQEEADIQTTQQIPEQLPLYPQLDESQIMEDEQLARLLQHAPFQQNEEHEQQPQPQPQSQQPQSQPPAQETPEEGGFFATIGRGLRSAYNLYQQYSSEQQLSQDEALARQLQAEEGGMPHASFQVQSPSVGRRANFPNFYNYDEDYDENEMFNPSPLHHPADPLGRLREANSLFRSMGTSPEHPLLQHLQEMIHQTQGGGPSSHPQVFFYPNQLPAHRYRYPRTVFQVNGIETLPPELLHMVQGESDTSYESLLQLADRLQPVSRGASNEQIEQLPTREFTEGSMPADQAKCGVCLSDYEKGEQLRTLPGCFHSFHKDCIDKWLQINKICPVCRHEITNTTS